MSRRQCTLADVIKLGNGKSRPNSTGKNPIYGGNGILGYTSESNYNGETIIIGRVGAYCGSVYYEERPIWISDNALAVKAKERNHLKYLYYFLSDLKLNQFAEGSSHPLMTQTLLNSIKIEISDNEIEQRTIASVLSSLDDKIDLLHRQNKTLEAMAETLFRQWFIEEADEGWEEVRLGDVIETISGYNHQQNQLSRDGDILLSMGSVVKSYSISLDSLRFIDAPTIDNKYICNVGEIIISTRDVTQNAEFLGYPAIIPTCLKNRKVILGSNLYKIVPKSTKISKTILYQLMKSTAYREYVKESASGTSILMLKKEDLMNFTFYLPPLLKLKKYSDIFEVTNQKLDYNYSSVRTLIKLRDTLLPKLMSGEVRVAV